MNSGGIRVPEEHVIILVKMQSSCQAGSSSCKAGLLTSNALSFRVAPMQGSFLALGSPALGIRKGEGRFLFQIRLSGSSFAPPSVCVGELMKVMIYEAADP